MKIDLSDYNAKLVREDIFKPKIWNERFQKTGTDNGDTVNNFASSKNV